MYVLDVDAKTGSCQWSLESMRRSITMGVRLSTNRGCWEAVTREFRAGEKDREGVRGEGIVIVSRNT